MVALAYADHALLTSGSAARSLGLSYARPLPVVTFGAGSEIYVPGQAADALYQVEFGAVRLHRLLSDGRRQVIAFYLAGETFGFAAEPIHSFFAEAIVATGLKAVVHPASGAVSPDLLSLALRGMIRAQEHILVIGRQTAVERIAGFIIDMASRQGDLEHIDLPMTRLDIADYLGLTIETVSRVFAKLRSAGLIKLRSIRCVEINNLRALQGLCA
ncbi:cyclic nucleotide-binding domain-containing protein [Rhizobium deserti]|uniref:Cyclic nucleotide-binding domain-containing protein n=1 Tax=Rhizobium deserti TaxID=2547961 RepID=A0A4V3APT0_9HYPH|nr:helix-turn-helix domain-containing protein [Rhizobium deserti]TDK38920.1 cyclic nucleotide-binding domain-containing protein [Rhizobium deserti]